MWDKGGVFSLRFAAGWKNLSLQGLAKGKNWSIVYINVCFILGLRSVCGNHTSFDYGFGQVLAEAVEDVVQIGGVPDHQVRLLSHLQAAQAVGSYTHYTPCR